MTKYAIKSTAIKTDEWLLGQVSDTEPRLVWCHKGDGGYLTFDNMTLAEIFAIENNLPPEYTIVPVKE